jgi:hypothetical protein
MTTFKQFLLEAEGHDLSGFARNIRVMLDNKIFLYRGTQTRRGDFLLTIPSTHPDADPSNTEDIMNFGAFIASERTIERTPKGSRVASRLADTWQVPNRKLSYFVTRDEKHAANFGELMLVIPADNVDLFAWSATDFNQGDKTLFKQKLMNVELTTKKLFREIAYLIEPRKRYDDEDDEEDADDLELRALLMKILKDAKVDPAQLKPLHVESADGIKLADLLIKNVEKIKKINRSKTAVGLINTLQEVLEKLDVASVGDVYAHASVEAFKIKTFSNLANIPKRLKSSDELWFNGKYLAVFLDSHWTANRNAEAILKLLLTKV